MSNLNYKEEGLRCANCFHNNHYDFDKNIVMDKCRHMGGYYSDYALCLCDTFSAFDNLSYLEYMYEQHSKQIMTSEFVLDLIWLITQNTLPLEQARVWVETRHNSGTLTNLEYLELTVALNEYEQTL